MLNDLKNTIIRSQRTQRNWDLSQSIKDEDLELFKIVDSVEEAFASLIHEIGRTE